MGRNMEEAIIVINSFLVSFWVFLIVSVFSGWCEAPEKCSGAWGVAMIFAWVFLRWCLTRDRASCGAHCGSWAFRPGLQQILPLPGDSRVLGAWNSLQG